jgi:hypothetical protein
MNNEPQEGAEQFKVATVIEKQVYVKGHWVTMKEPVEWALVATFDKLGDAFSLGNRLHAASEKMYVYDKESGKDVLTPQTK